MKINSKTTVIAVLSVATVILSITTRYYYVMYESSKESMIRGSLTSTEFVLGFDEDFSNGDNEELKRQIDGSLDLYLTGVHRMGQRPDILSGNNSQFERVLRQARKAGYDFSGEELAGKRLNYHNDDSKP